MAAEDYLDFFEPQHDERYSEVECKRCGTAGLHWEDEGGTWRLYDRRDQPHRCNMAKVAMGDFEVLP